MNIAPQSDYMMQNALLREVSNPAAGTSNPQIEDTLMGWANAKARTNAETINTTQNMALEQKKFLTQMLDARKQLKSWEKQNNIATLLAGAMVPVQGLASYQQIKKADAATTQTQKLIDSNKEIAAAYRTSKNK